MGVQAARGGGGDPGALRGKQAAPLRRAGLCHGQAALGSGPQAAIQSADQGAAQHTRSSHRFIAPCTTQAATPWPALLVNTEDARKSADGPNRGSMSGLVSFPKA